MLAKSTRNWKNDVLSTNRCERVEEGKPLISPSDQFMSSQAFKEGKDIFLCPCLAPLVKNALKDKGVSGDIKEYNTGSKTCNIFEIGISQ